MTEAGAAESEERLIRLVERLLQSGALSTQDPAVDASLFGRMGFDVTAGEITIPADIERLDEARIIEGLSTRAREWLSELHVFPVIGSTSSALMQRAEQASVQGVVNLAELQVRGRGRRGRTWLSPFARNLAMSLGVWLPQPPQELGGFSLAVGLATVDVLASHGIAEVELKWPNDVLLAGKKLAGVLIELIPRERGTELVVGIGMNLQLPEAARLDIDQPATDLAQTGVSIARNDLAARLLSSIVDYTDGFAARGFAPMQSAFDQHHRLQGSACHLVQGSTVIEGVVLGVTAQGELLLNTAEGTRAFSAGEVSLRSAGV
ncbi:MAG: biotin--[acetyl-CoA-carboxylase] ligase [Gammaproteobacteria bacterium]|nr:biotin--[acetyl-CoA-carboxylase] ligase [Gammaproteobacteria bacterium]